MKRVHITGIAPRSGTTLMMELLVSCFKFDGHADHELGLVFDPVGNLDLFCSKNPGIDDLRFAPLALRRMSDLWVICIVRDPRDIIVSRHQLDPEAYWANLGMIERRMRYFRSVVNHERFIVIKYEDLVSNPNEVQSYLSRTIWFLEKLADFSEFTEVANPTDRSLKALGGIKPISTLSIGRWKDDLPRIKAQIERFGSMNKLLAELEYLQEENWQSILESVIADNGRGHFEDSPRRNPVIGRARRWYRNARFLLGVPIKRPAVISSGGA